jgi:hypothetical protein
MADLVSDAEVTATWPGFGDLDASEQAALITAASAAVENHCRRTFAATAATEYHDGRGLGRIWLRRRPITAIASVTVDGVALVATDGDFGYDPATGELYRGDGSGEPRHFPPFPHGRRNITVVYTAGYATVPADVKRATIQVVKTVSDQSRFSQTLQTEQLGDYRYVVNTTSQKSELPLSAQALLAPYVQGDAV